MTTFDMAAERDADPAPGIQDRTEPIARREQEAPASGALSRQALLDLGRRGQFDCFYFLLVNAAIPLFAPRVLRCWFFALYSAVNVLCNACSLLYLRRWPREVTKRPNYASRFFSFCKCGQNLSLGCMAGWCFLSFGINPLTSLTTMIAMAFAQATLSSLKPHAALLRATIFCCLIPPLAASLKVGGATGYGTALILLTEFVYLWFQGGTENLEYRRSAQQTQELLRARQKATQEGARIGDALLANAARHTATVAERNRIACEWHDTLLAGFSAISWQLDEARLRLESEGAHAAAAIELARKMVHHYRSEARLIIADLLYEESDTNDLVSLILQEIPRIIGGEAVEFTVTSQGEAARLPPDITRQLLRVCQEAVSNAVRHAEPALIRIHVEFRGNHSIAVTIADDGRGFSPSLSQPSPIKPGHFGLEIMKQRARRLGGEMLIESAPGRGTTISVVVPYRADFTMTPTRILVVEDQYFSRLALHTVLDSHADMKIVCEADTGRAGIAAFRERPPDVTIMDLKLPDLPGIEVIKALREIDPAARIVVLSNFEGSEYLHRATDAGAMAYLTKDSNADELLQAIRAVRVGQSFIPPSLLHLLESRVAGNDLTSREHGVLELLVLGWSNKQIGDHLGIAEKTVRIHMSSIFSKLGAANRTQAVLIALQRGFVDPQPLDKGGVLEEQASRLHE
jgi:DNA-binding NarL/FixJ family response regulator/signal transduction histidine kinase